MDNAMLGPAAALICWTLIMLAWMAATRFPAIAKSTIDIKTAKPGGRGQDLDGVLPDQVMWKSHNHTHLMEQPTIFYAAVLILAIAGAAPLDAWVAWAYVALRVVHSIWQATVNRLPVRITLFTLSTICLGFLAVRALILTVFA